MNDFPYIRTDYETLLDHDGPVVFTGKDAEGRRIVASLVNYDTDSTRYFHAVVADDAYDRFYKSNMSLRDVYREAEFLATVQVITDPMDPDEPITNQIKFEDANADELPTEDSFLPQVQD